MKNDYLNFVSEYGVILTPIYLIFSISLLFLLKRFLKVKISNLSLIVFLIYYCLVSLFMLFNTILPKFPDVLLFSKIITTNYFPENQSQGVKNYFILSYPLRIISLFHIESFIILQLTLFLLSLIFFWASFEIILRFNQIKADFYKISKVYLTLCAIYPAYLLFIPVPLREFLVLFGLSLTMYGLIKYIYLRGGILYFLLGGIIFVAIRPQMLIVWVILSNFLIRSKHIKLLLLVVSPLIVSIAFIKLTGNSVTPQFLSYLRNSLVEKYSYSGMVYGGNIEWNNYIDLLLDLPKLYLQFLLSPIPILIHLNPFNLLSAFIDFLYCILVYILAFKESFKVSKYFLLTFILISVLSSIWEFHVGGAVRHRMMAVSVLLPIAAFQIYKLKLKFFGVLNEPRNSNIHS